MGLRDQTFRRRRTLGLTVVDTVRDGIDLILRVRHIGRQSRSFLTVHDRRDHAGDEKPAADKQKGAMPVARPPITSTRPVTSVLSTKS